MNIESKPNKLLKETCDNKEFLKRKPIEILLAESLTQPESILEEVKTVDGIKSTLSPFRRLEDHRRYYPPIVIAALRNLYREYNDAFAPLIRANQEQPTDYSSIMESGRPIIPFVQIDMIGLPDGFLAQVPSYNEQEVTELLRHNIFEIENSIAMYPLLEGIFSYNGQDSVYKMRFRAHLDRLRETSGRPIALLALTDEKLMAMRETEFGKRKEETLSDEEVMSISGFDKLMGPDDFRSYLHKNGGSCKHLLFVRSSYSLMMLKRPDLRRYPEILWDPQIRCIIKENAITPSIDNPPFSKKADRRGGHDPRRSGMMNDTKGYMEPMSMARNIDNIEQLDKVAQHYAQRGCQVLRLKPLLGSYGCYGHMRIAVEKIGFYPSSELSRNIKARGPYVVQPEVTIPTTYIQERGFVYIDRILMAFTGNEPKLLTGFRNFMPLDSQEAQQGRVHGGSSSVHGEILANI